MQVVVSFRWRPAHAQAPAGGDQLQGDRIHLVQQFLTTLYPDLKYTDAEVRARWQRKEDLAGGFELRVRNCFHGPAPAPSIPPSPPPPLPYCDAPPPPPEKVLYASIGTSPVTGIHIGGFHSWGGMLTERLDVVIGEINRQLNNGADEYPEGLKAQQEREAIKILNAANPAYGPAKRAEFVKFVPVDTFYRFTSCRLRPETAEFVVQSGGSLMLEWYVSGTWEDTKYSCTVIFEPFSGYVISF